MENAKPTAQEVLANIKKSFKEANEYFSEKYDALDKVRAKFQCTSIEPYGEDKIVRFQAVISSEGENADFAKYTPQGKLEMTISRGTMAYDYFEHGKEYYLNLGEAV